MYKFILTTNATCDIIIITGKEKIPKINLKGEEKIMEKTVAQWIDEAENFKSEFEKSTGRQPTLEDVKAEIATIDGIEDVESYAEKLFSHISED